MRAFERDTRMRYIAHNPTGELMKIITERTIKVCKQVTTQNLFFDRHEKKF